MTSPIIEKLTTDIRVARLAKDPLTGKPNQAHIDNLVTLRASIAHGLSQKQSVPEKKTLALLLAEYTQALSITKDETNKALYESQIALVKVYSEYSKPQLSKAELAALLAEQKPQSIREWMGYLKLNYPDQFSGQIASQLFNNIL